MVLTGNSLFSFRILEWQPNFATLCQFQVYTDLYCLRKTLPYEVMPVNPINTEKLGNQAFIRGVLEVMNDLFPVSLFNLYLRKTTNHDFYGWPFGRFGITGIINMVQLKKWKHFVVVLSETIKKHINSKNIYNVQEPTDPLLFL